MSFTPEQKRAIWTQDRNLIVTAGAGSGKTRVLVERFLALLAQNPDWQLTELVAITFTEKAAREMRERIRDAIQERIRQNPHENWQNHASLLDQARIGTIHSLCAQILRANPAQVPLDPAFEVLDENEAALLRHLAVEQALGEMATQHSAELLLIYGIPQVRETLMKFAVSTTGHAFLDALPTHPDELLENWASWQENAQLRWREQVQSDALIGECLNWRAPMPAGDTRTLLFEKIWALCADFYDLDDVEYVRKIILELADIKLTGGSKKNWGEALFEEAKGILSSLRDRAKFHRDSFPLPLGETETEEVRRIFLWAEAVKIAMSHYEQLKRARARVDFDDLESMTADLLGKNPDVRARYAGLEFRHVMVDEFQDTNTRQREIIYALTGIDPNAAENPQGRLFVVGDPKQSIYAFRGADVSVFRAVRDEILSLGGEEVPLSHSFRTQSELIAGFNHFFQSLFQNPQHKFEVDFGLPMSAQRQAESFHLRPIRLLNIPQTANFSKVDQLRQWEAYEIAQILHGLKTEAVPVFDRALGGYRPFDYGDAVLLFRSLSSVGIYEEVLKTQGIPYLTISGRGYYNRQEVWDMLNLLQALHNPADNLALASVLRSPMFGLSDEGLFILRLCRDSENKALPLWEALALDSYPYPLSPADSAALGFAQSVLSRLRSVAERVTVDSLMEMALDETAYDAILTALPDGNRRRENLEKLQAKAQASGRVSLGEFMLYVQDLTGLEPHEGEALVESRGVVQIMSVHASKGLEFPVVFIPNAQWERQRNKYPNLIHDPEWGVVCLVKNEEDSSKGFAYEEVLYQQGLRELAESKRLLYVAMTRAQDYLFLTGHRPKSENQSWLSMIDIHAGADWLEKAEAQSEPIDLDSPTSAQQWEKHSAAEALTPPLLAGLPVAPLRQIRHLSVSQLEQLGEGSAHSRQFFRQSVLHDSPPPLRPLQQDDRAPYYVQRRLIGQVVHRALQLQIYKRFSEAQIYQFLESYAWNEGVTEKELLGKIVAEAQNLLAQYKEPASLAGAEKILREVPFIYRVQDRILHGAIDVLYQYRGEWYILDYKTAIIQPKWVQWHAQRYRLQLGAYAQAVQERKQSAVHVHLYYLHLNHLEELTNWKNELERLDFYLHRAMED